MKTASFLLLLISLLLNPFNNIGEASDKKETNKGLDTEEIYFVAYEDVKDKIIEKNKIEKYGQIVAEYKSVGVFAIRATEKNIKKLKKDDPKITIEKNKKKETLVQTIGWQHSSEHTNTNELWSYGNGSTGKGVTIAVIDDGIYKSHEDLNKENIEVMDCRYGIGKPVEEANESFCLFYSGSSFGGQHGTHVAGIIAAQDNELGIKGIAPDVKLVAYRVDEVEDYNGDGRAQFTNLFIYNAYDDIANRNKDRDPNNNIDIVNMSYGSTNFSDIERKIIQEMYKSGAILGLERESSVF